MDERIETGQMKLNVIEWALLGMTQTDREPEKKDLSDLRTLVAEVNRDLDAVIEGSSK